MIYTQFLIVDSGLDAEIPYKALANCCSHSVLRGICPETLFENGTGPALRKLTCFFGPAKIPNLGVQISTFLRFVKFWPPNTVFCRAKIPKYFILENWLREVSPRQARRRTCFLPAGVAKALRAFLCEPMCCILPMETLIRSRFSIER